MKVPDEERRRAYDRELAELRADVRSLASDVQDLLSTIKVLDEWRKNHDAYYRRENELVAESFKNVKADMLQHNGRISATERTLEKHSVWVALVSAAALALIAVIVQHMALKGG